MDRLVSLGVPARNEESAIEATLESLVAQKLPSHTKLEVIVCVNASRDATAQVVRRIAARDPRIKLIETSRPGKPNAMNLIKRQARGGVLVFCDADTLAGKHAVAKLLEALDARPELSAVGAVTKPLERRGRGLAEALASAHRKTHRRTHLIGSFLAVRTHLLPDYPTNVINDDGWLSSVLGEGKYALIPGVEVHQAVATSLLDYFRQVIRWEAGRLQLHRWRGKAVPTTLGDFRKRLSYWRALRTDEKIAFPLILPVRVFARVAARRALERGEFTRGWNSPKRLTPRKPRK